MCIYIYVSGPRSSRSFEVRTWPSSNPQNASTKSPRAYFICLHIPRSGVHPIYVYTHRRTCIYALLLLVLICVCIFIYTCIHFSHMLNQHTVYILHMYQVCRLMYLQHTYTYVLIDVYMHTSLSLYIYICAQVHICI